MSPRRIAFLSALTLGAVTFASGPRGFRALTDDCTPGFSISPPNPQVSQPVDFLADTWNLDISVPPDSFPRWAFSDGLSAQGWIVTRSFSAPGYYGVSMGAWTVCGDYRETAAEIFFVDGTVPAVSVQRTAHEERAGPANGLVGVSVAPISALGGAAAGRSRP
jgi:hypothetical protein